MTESREHKVKTHSGRTVVVMLQRLMKWSLRQPIVVSVVTTVLAAVTTAVLASLTGRLLAPHGTHATPHATVTVPGPRVTVTVGTSRPHPTVTTTEIVAVASGGGGLATLAALGTFGAGLGTLGLGAAAVYALRRRSNSQADTADDKTT